MLHEPISSIDLMERAGTKCTQWVLDNLKAYNEFIIFCGPGNNGGDGLAISRMLITNNKQVVTYVLEQEKLSPDFNINLERLRAVGGNIHYIKNSNSFPPLTKNQIIIDALFGNGLNRPLKGLTAELVQYINGSSGKVISIDIPSGMFADRSSIDNNIIKASYTLSFQQPKLAFLMPENQPFTGKVVVVDIHLHTDYYNNSDSHYHIITHEMAASYIQPRNPFAHKGDFGNLALVAGSYGMMGAVVLAAKACLRSGAGKLTCYVPGYGYPILQTAVPEAMCISDRSEKQHTSIHLPTTKYNAIGIGPGMGGYDTNVAVIEKILATAPPKLVLDADALNTIAAHPYLLKQLPYQAIITPHPKEFERLFGKTGNNFERLELAMQQSSQLGIIIILKGRYSAVVTPSGDVYFNSTGNPGMATAGSGDVLTGILLGLLGQYDNPVKVALLGTYLHGLSGDRAAAKKSEEGMIAGDLVEFLPEAYQALKTV